jgi:hypothetical protein
MRRDEQCVNGAEWKFTTYGAARHRLNPFVSEYLHFSFFVLRTKDRQTGERKNKPAHRMVAKA